jgi:hypothetical protein
MNDMSEGLYAASFANLPERVDEACNPQRAINECYQRERCSRDN